MGIGKMLGLAALGVGAIAAAPFTGGGSIIGAATLAGSLGTAGAVAGAVGAGAIGATAGKILSDKEEEEEERKRRKLAEANQKAEKATDIAKAHEEHTNYILSLSALGISMANADGEISEEEQKSFVDLVEQIIKSKEELKNAEFDGDKKILEKQIEIIDRKIDNMVFDLYWLNDEEREMVNVKKTSKKEFFGF